MKTPVLLAAVAALLVAIGIVSWRLVEAPGTAAASAATKPCSTDQQIFGRIHSLTPLTPAKDTYELRFDPAWFLTGETANEAAVEDGAIAPGDSVPNDYYIVGEGHRLLTYLVPTSARVHVLIQGAPLDESGSPSRDVSVPELARLVAGEQPVKLFESLDSGVWLRVKNDTVCSLEQQYRP